MRFLPVFQEAIRRDPQGGAFLNDCDKCMTTNSRQQRQAIGCGHESPIDHAHPWSPSSVFSSWSGREPTVCPGYTTKLPQVIEAARSHFHWEKGSLEHVCDGERPTDLLVIGIEHYEAATLTLRNHINNERADRDGAR